MVFYSKLLGMKVKGRSKMEQTKRETVGLESEDGGFLLGLNYYEKDSPTTLSTLWVRG